MYNEGLENIYFDSVGLQNLKGVYRLPLFIALTHPSKLFLNTYKHVHSEKWMQR
jgi:hypothetical protein